MQKPSHVFDRDDDWDALVDFAADPQPRATLGVVSGRRRQGKTYLLSALAAELGGFYFEAAQGTEAESLRMLGAEVARRIGAPAPLSFADWYDALAAVFGIAGDSPTLVVIDEFPYLMKANPALPSLLQRAIDQHAQGGRTSLARVLICGSAMSVMGSLLAGTAPLRGRAGLELIIQPFDYRLAAQFWGVTDPKLAAMLHAVVGGTPAYRREFVRDDAPSGMADFDSWVERTVLNPRRPLFREARYLLAEETDVRDAALYNSVLAAIAAGNATRGGIANYLGRRAADISHPLTVLEDSRLIAREPDAFRDGRSQYLIAEPLIAFYQAVMRPEWRSLELGEAGRVWSDAKPRFESQVMGPHFEKLCREHAMLAGSELFGSPAGRVSAGTVADPDNRTQIQVDVVALAPSQPAQPKKLLALGEAKWGDVLDMRHLSRLRRARNLLAAKGFDTEDTVLIGYSGAGFDEQLRTEARSRHVRLVGVDEMYEPA